VSDAGGTTGLYPKKPVFLLEFAVHPVGTELVGPLSKSPLLQDACELFAARSARFTSALRPHAFNATAATRGRNQL